MNKELSNKIKLIFNIKKHFDVNNGHKEKIVDDLKLTGFSIDENTCYLYYANNRFVVFDDGDVWYDKSAEIFTQDLLNKIDALYRKKKIESIILEK